MAIKAISTCTLVEVRSGIPISVKVFQNEMQAKSEEKKIRNAMNLDNDETNVFQVDVPIEEK